MLVRFNRQLTGREREAPATVISAFLERVLLCLETVTSCCVLKKGLYEMLLAQSSLEGRRERL